MKRRRFLAGVASGAVVTTSGCLSPQSYTCLPFSRFDIVIGNNLHSPQTVSITIQTQWLRRTVFSETIHVSAATDTAGIAVESDVISHPGTYRVAVTFGEETYTHTWNIKCSNLEILLGPHDDQISFAGYAWGSHSAG